jgi:hypothetical protein
LAIYLSSAVESHLKHLIIFRKIIEDERLFEVESGEESNELDDYS